jgi:hypothetical protein
MSSFSFTLDAAEGYDTTTGFFVAGSSIIGSGQVRQIMAMSVVPGFL